MSVPELIFEDRLRVPANVFELNSFRGWVHSDEFPEKLQVAYIGGDVEIDMSPEEVETHNKLKVELTAALRTWVKEQDLGELLLDGCLLVCPAADLANEPDLMFCSWQSLETGRVRFAEWVEGSNRFVEVLGTPDLVVEIVSRSSVRKDTVSLRQRYFDAGIAEYWLIDARGASVDFQLLVRGEASYEPVPPDEAGYRPSVVLAAAFRIDRDRNRQGRYRYSVLRK